MKIDWTIAFAAFGLSFLVVAILLQPLIVLLRRRQVIDRPNARSSHEVPTPLGGGLVVIPVAVIAWICLSQFKGLPPVREILGISGLTMLIAFISFLDDLRHVSAAIRLAAHIFAVAVGIEMMPDDVLFLQGLVPPQADTMCIAFAWVWFINAYNFMDGIDGISGVETTSVGIGIIAIALVTGGFVYLAAHSAVLVGVMAAFLLWNWSPAKIFLGDVGSAPLGYMVGWLLLTLVLEGQWAPAIILPAYYLADATLTLTLRLIRGEKIWHAHREHYFQRAIRGGLNHRQVSSVVLLCNLALVAAATAAAMGHIEIGLVAATGIIVVTLSYFATRRLAE